MSDHHNDHHSNEPKPVSFTTPLIFGAVVLTAILLLTSLGDPCHGKCVCMENCSKECMEACEKGDHSKHPEGQAYDKKADDVKEKESAVETMRAVDPVDSTEAKKEAAAEHH